MKKRWNKQSSLQPQILEWDKKPQKNKQINKQTKLKNKHQYAVNQKHEKIYQIIHDE